MDFSQGALQAAQALVQAESLVVQGLPVESVEALLQMTGQVVHLEHADVVLNAENKVHATGKLSLEKARAWEANWAVDCADLSTIPTEVRGAALWPEAGVVRSEGHAAGSLDGLQRKAWNEIEGKLSLSVSNLQLQAATLESLLVEASSAHGKVDLSQFLLTLDAANHLNAQGTVDLNQPEFPLTAKADVQLPELAKLSPWGEIFNAPAIFQGRMEAAWEATGQLQPMSLAGGGRVEISQVRLANVPEILGLTAQLEQAGPKLSVPSLEATAGPWRVQGQVLLDGAELSIPQLQGWLKDTPLLTLSAALNTQSKDAPCALKLEAKGLDLAKLATALGQSWPATATVTTSADFHGSLNALEGTWDTQVAKIKLASKYAAALQPGRFAMHAKLSDGQFTTTGELVQPPLEPLAFKAALPLNLGALMETPALAKELAFNAEVHLPTSRLDFLPKLVPQLRALQGTAALDLVATGTATHPVLKGAAVILAPEANFTSASLPSVKDLAIRLHANETAVTLDEASLVLAGGKLHASGQAGLQDFANPTLDFKVVAEEVLLVRDDTISLRANADLRCQGTLSKAAVTGTVDLVRGRVFQEVEIVPLSLPNQLPPPPPPAILGKATSPSLPPPLGQWNFDIAIKTRDPIRLTGNLARGGAVVDLHLAGPGSKPELTGKVDLKDTWLKLPFSRLNLTQGTVSFTKEAPFDPQIELLGEAVVSDYMITLDATGRAVDPKVRFSSSPPLSEGDIASLLATGATTGKLSGADGEAAGRAIFLLVQSAYRKLFPKLASSLEDAEPPRLSFELSGFGSAPNSKGVAAVYELNAKYKVIGRVGEDGNFRGLLYYLIRFK